MIPTPVLMVHISLFSCFLFFVRSNRRKRQGIEEEMTNRNKMRIQVNYAYGSIPSLGTKLTTITKRYIRSKRIKIQFNFRWWNELKLMIWNFTIYFFEKFNWVVGFVFFQLFWSFVILPLFKCNWEEEKYSYRNDWKNAKQKHVSLLLTFLLNRAFSCFFSSFSSSSKSDENMCALTGNWSTCGISFGSLSQLLFFFRFSKNRHVHVHSVYVFQLQICSITTHFQAPNYMSNHVCFSVYQMQNSFTKHSRISKTYRYVFGFFSLFNLIEQPFSMCCGNALIKCAAGCSFFGIFMWASEWVCVYVRFL